MKAVLAGAALDTPVPERLAEDIETAIAIVRADEILSLAQSFHRLWQGKNLTIAVTDAAFEPVVPLARPTRASSEGPTKPDSHLVKRSLSA